MDDDRFGIKIAAKQQHQQQQQQVKNSDGMAWPSLCKWAPTI